MIPNRLQGKKILVIIFCICFSLYIFSDYDFKNKFLYLRHRFGYRDAAHNISQAYFVNTDGCRMPYFPVIDNEIMKFMSKPERLTCEKPLTRTSDSGSSILFNMNEEEFYRFYKIKDLNSVQCFYKEIKRKSDMENTYGRNIPFKLPIRFQLNSKLEIQPGFEVIGLMCLNAENKTFYKDVHFFITNKLNQTRAAINRPVVITTPKKGIRSGRKKTPKVRSVHQNLADGENLGAGSNFNESEERLSVMLLGIDSVSHLNFLRQLQGSSNYIKKNLTHVEFWGYNKVGDNTYPNLIPVLAGLNESELNASCLELVKHVNFDSCHFIWKRFKKAGYQTVFAEDVAWLGLFNYCRPGFNEKPTDYYFRSIILEMENQIAQKRSGNVYFCMGGRRTVDVILELIRKLMPYLRTQDFFSFFWTSTMSHDYINTPMLLDAELMCLFQLFDKVGIFNKTVVFLMSDHGLRWGNFRRTHQGMIEERQPLLIALYPKWFRRKYAMAIKNLEHNSKRLTTPFDLHATLLDLLDLRNIKDESLKFRTRNIAGAEALPRGISLFLPVPKTRTCEMAGIKSHWCLCQRHEELPTNDSRVQRAAYYIIEFINSRLKAHPQCQTLSLSSISKAMLATPQGDLNNAYNIDITVRIEAKPGEGLFESTVRMSSYVMGLTGTISRVNLYGNQSYCINEPDLKLFCYCLI